jgi:hypothetical protein
LYNDLMETTIYEVAPMNPLTGKCTVCRDYARDCDCHICPVCEEGIRGDETACGYCDYECD